ncbi:hypothetical protein DFJ73DRAFT_820818 [Zopfochytrium polystomum]|nr:hypothetical protein DFJ73DRAFT_820818 [Zopfochytrium polystomum]
MTLTHEDCAEFQRPPPIPRSDDILLLLDGFRTGEKATFLKRQSNIGCLWGSGSSYRIKQNDMNQRTQRSITAQTKAAWTIHSLRLRGILTTTTTGVVNLIPRIVVATRFGHIKDGALTKRTSWAITTALKISSKGRGPTWICHRSFVLLLLLLLLLLRLHHHFFHPSISPSSTAIN